MFKKGDKVYSILRGWGEVTAVGERNLGYAVKFPNEPLVTYHGDGKRNKNDINPELYHAEPTITVPKRRVEHKGWIQVCNKAVGDGYNISSCIATSKELLDKWFSDKDDYTKQEITFYTEE